MEDPDLLMVLGSKMEKGYSTDNEVIFSKLREPRLTYIYSSLP